MGLSWAVPAQLAACHWVGEGRVPMDPVGEGRTNVAWQVSTSGRLEEEDTVEQGEHTRMLGIDLPRKTHPCQRGSFCLLRLVLCSCVPS